MGYSVKPSSMVSKVQKATRIGGGSFSKKTSAGKTNRNSMARAVKRLRSGSSKGQY